jgi:hypothetical protein
MSIQPGDTVEIMFNCFSYRCSDNKGCLLERGERFVVTMANAVFVYYKDPLQNEWRVLRDDLKKVTPVNQVEIKFR